MIYVALGFLILCWLIVLGILLDIWWQNRDHDFDV